MPSILRSAIAVATLLAPAITTALDAPYTIPTPIPTPTGIVNPKTAVNMGCFKSFEPLQNYGTYLYQSDGNCQRVCVMLKKAVFAVSDGEYCWCGDMMPANNTYVADTECDTPCPGDKNFKCGGNRRLRVYNSGVSLNKLEYYVQESVTTSSSSSTVDTASSATMMTPTTTQAPESKPNVAGIAAGVVVGVVGLAAIVGGVFFFLRQRKRKELEEEHKRQAAVSSFFSSGKSHHSASSISDSRLDPDIMHRRQSDGSIADNQDYSRRILKVTNPDGF